MFTWLSAPVGGPLSRISLKAPRGGQDWLCCGCAISNGNIADVHYFIGYIFSKFSLTYLVFLETLWSPLEFKIKFCECKQCCLCSPFVISDSPVSVGGQMLRLLETYKTVFKHEAEYVYFTLKTNVKDPSIHKPMFHSCGSKMDTFPWHRIISH